MERREDREKRVQEIKEGSSGFPGQASYEPDSLLLLGGGWACALKRFGAQAGGGLER
jgi:hypothetical protein